MTTALITHSDCLGHITPTGHPEQVARLNAVLDALSTPTFDSLLRREAPLASDENILLAHPAAHLASIKDTAPENEMISLDADTHMSKGSLDAAYRGVGANTLAVDMILSGEVKNAFCAIRPPGHHAEREKPMGFCLFGNVAIAAKYAISKGLSKVAIMDFDVHHGNGTQDLVWDDPNILFTSTHQSPLYPGTGATHETGAHNNVVNATLAANTDGAAFRAAMEARILPAIDAFKPELLFISAGFDAHYRDPLANLNWQDDDFAWATHKLCDLADKHCGGRLVSTLEGGYDLTGLASACASHVNVLMERG